MANTNATPGTPGFDPFDALDRIAIGDVTFLGWRSDQAAPPSPEFVIALAQLGVSPPVTGHEAAVGAAPVAADVASGASFVAHGEALAAALARLAAVHTGETADVALDATHAVQLQAAWLV